jgi:RNA polymerase sigma-70 factor (ECF subfamily)
MPVNNSDEKRLVALLAEGDASAFEELYFLYSPRLSGYLFKLVKSEVYAKELLQEIFIKVWNKRESLDPDRSFRSYLFRIAENCAYDFFRKTAHDKKLHAAFIKVFETEYNNVEETLSNKENERLLQTAIDSLPPKRRQVFQLIKMEERSYEEVSSMLNISSSTISDHVVKANKYVRERLKLWHITIIIFMQSIS